MGQYYLIVNLDKKQYLHPHKCGDGLKLCEFGSSGDGTMFALAGLLANGNGRGGGDIRSDDPIIGSWAGDRIVVAGDYADKGGFGVPATDNVFTLASRDYEDISKCVMLALIAVPWFADTCKRRHSFADPDGRSMYGALTDTDHKVEQEGK